MNRKNAVEVKLTVKFSIRYPVFPVSLVKPYHQPREDTFPSRNKIHIPTGHSGSRRLPWPRKLQLHGKDHRKYLFRFKNQIADEDTWLKKASIPYGDLQLRRFRASRRAENCHKL
ncbi:hypothetical protein O181_028504 [Austropuccinia psidii MF-1]|uniref:Uncharacterized protein n=1 Tax=Austropuccinia psidii MF-1 TaxID=1389203 RepID=A0A9Q3CP17_9BASI|nr:hypothetical protein [Austropuccinia psidii MF-1]